ncbi:MAG: hypothetical protein AAF726_24010 [Planctomycetota bacterium]
MPFSTSRSIDAGFRQSRYELRGEPGFSDPSGASGRGVHPSEHPATEADVLGLGMKLFLASLTMIFGATFVAYGIIWWRNRADWEGAISGGEVAGLAIATILLVVADLSASRARRAVGDAPRARKLTLFTAVAATIYLIVQTISWVPLIAQSDPDGDGTLRMEGFLFLMLTFAHAAHVLGGIVANAIVYLRSGAERGPTRGALQMLFEYWRFLTAMWIAVLALLIAF